MDLPATGLVFEQHNRLGAVLTAAIRPDVGRVCRLPVLFLQHLDRGLVTVNDALRQETLLQRIIDANQVLLTRPDHPVAKGATAHGDSRRARTPVPDDRAVCRRQIYERAQKPVSRPWQYCPARAVWAWAR